jgi:hypothetical protein
MFHVSPFSRRMWRFYDYIIFLGKKQQPGGVNKKCIFSCNSMRICIIMGAGDPKEGLTMMNRMFVLLVAGLLVSTFVFPQTPAPDFKGLDFKIGNVRIPRDFVHAGKDYKRGVYWVTLKAKAGVPYFNIHNRKKELLFEEMGVLQLRKRKSAPKRIWHRVNRTMLRGYEYYRIKVTRPDSYIKAFLLIKQQPKKKKKPPKVKTTKPPDKF